MIKIEDRKSRMEDRAIFNSLSSILNQRRAQDIG